MWFGAFYAHFFTKGKCYPVAKGAKLPDFPGIARFLCAKVIAGKPYHDEFLAKMCVQLLELCILCCVAACAGNVHNEYLFSCKVGKINYATVQSVHFKSMNTLRHVFAVWREVTPT